MIADAAVDAVVVTSWGPTHAEYVLAAIEARKPVFCEKPLATTADDGLRIVEAEQAAGRRLVQVGFMRRYDLGYRAMKKVLDSGGIGAPLMVHCAHRNPSAPESYHSEMATQDTAVHEIDTIRWLLGEEIVAAQVLTPRRTSKRLEHLRDPQIMLFELASGVRVDVEFAQWVNPLHDGRPIGPSAGDGYAAAVTCDATVEALHSGRTVPVRMKDRPAFFGS